MRARVSGPGPLAGALAVVAALALVALPAAALPGRALSAQQVPAASAGAPQTAAGRALVLSTGASRGLAHVGALVGLDSLGYDPDLVVGTSMGAVVGALYAAGYTPHEIRSMIEVVDWGAVFMPTPLVLGPDRRAHSPALGLGVSLASFEVSRGFIADARVNRLLVRLLFAASAGARGDFDRLARRYRAVVADLATGEQVVIAGGDLARAARISMGAPGFFAPLDGDGRLLTDGGIANYLPISVARALGAGHVIAVDVSRPDSAIESRDPAALGGRAVGLLMRNAVPDTLADVLVRPGIDPDLSGAFFPSDPGPLFRLGLEAALAADPPAVTGTPAEPARLPAPPESFSGLRVDVPDGGLEAFVRKAFEDIAPGPFDPEEVLERVDRLYASDLVTGVWPHVGPGDTLIVRVEAAPRASLWLAPGYDNDRGGRLWMALENRIRGGGLPVELSLAASTTGVETWGELALRGYPLARPIAGVLAFHGIETDVRILEPDSLAGELRVRRAGGWLGAEMRRLAPELMITLGAHAEYVDEEDGEEGLSFGPLLRVSVPTAPGLIVGVASSLRAQLRFGEVAYGAADLRLSRGFALAGLAAAAVAEVAVTVGDAPLDARPALGDEHRMPGFGWGAERGAGRVVAGFDLAQPVMMGGVLRARLRAGAAPNDPDDLAELDTWVAGAALEGAWTLPFGPIVVGVGVNTRGRHRLGVSLGSLF